MKLVMKTHFLFVLVLAFRFVLCYNSNDLFSVAVCQVNCIDNASRQNLQNQSSCEDICNGNNIDHSFYPEIIYDNRSTIAGPYLHCRDSMQLTFKWKYNLPINESFVFIIDWRDRDSDWTRVDMTRETMFTMDNLNSTTDYKMRLWAVHSNGHVAGPATSAWISTLDEHESPKTVPSIWLINLEIIDDDLYAKIQWTPNTENSCFYDLLWFNDDGVADYSQLEVKQPSEKFEVVIGQLNFESNYSVAITAKSSDWNYESAKTWLHIQTPACLEIFANLSICEPSSPTNVSVSESMKGFVNMNGVSSEIYDVYVTWSMPELIPDYYSLMLTSLLSANTHLPNSSQTSLTVPGDCTEALFTDVIVGLQYQVSVTAVSRGGPSKQTLLYRQIRHSQTNNKFFWMITSAVLAISVVMTFVFAILFVYHRSAKRKRYVKRCKYFEELEQKAQMNLKCIKNNEAVQNITQKTDKWELYHNQIILQNILGEGAFGLVRKGWLTDSYGRPTTKVAVKMLKDPATVDHIKQFLQEIEIMKSVGSHPHLVSILGCCTQPEVDKNMMLVVEYCALGDLQKFLRKIWDRKISHSIPQLNYADLSLDSSQNSANIIINKLYEFENVTREESEIKPTDLLSFARQICIGMEFLANMKIIHRDLAARNVLVCDEKCVKIADFGLSRDVYRDNVYKKIGNGKLPIRWMAIESITHQVYTAQSDVWSFGILLWEIVTLGGSPYPSIPTNAILKHLRSGKRMDRPSNCSFELYSVMSSCWRARPKDRPTFTELRKSLDKFLENMTSSKYLDLDVLASDDFLTIKPSKKDSSYSLILNQSIDTFISERYVRPFSLTTSRNQTNLN